MVIEIEKKWRRNRTKLCENLWKKTRDKHIIFSKIFAVFLTWGEGVKEEQKRKKIDQAFPLRCFASIFHRMRILYRKFSIFLMEKIRWKKLECHSSTGFPFSLRYLSISADSARFSSYRVNSFLSRVLGNFRLHVSLCPSRRSSRESVLKKYIDLRWDITQRRRFNREN